jgi:hypothetical protein
MNFFDNLSSSFQGFNPISMFSDNFSSIGEVVTNNPITQMGGKIIDKGMGILDSASDLLSGNFLIYIGLGLAAVLLIMLLK